MRRKRAEQMMKVLIKFLLLTSLAAVCFSCQPNQTIINSSRSQTVNAPEGQSERPKDTFESALEGVQRSGFRYIIVMRRQDGGKIDGEDGRYIRRASPPQTNQFILTDEDRTVIAASNYPFPPENLDVLRERFKVEDLTEPEMKQTNTNSNDQTVN